MNGEIQNCAWQFDVQCPKLWDSLVPTDEEGVRVCDVCLKNVYRCNSDEEVAVHAKLGHCVAIDCPIDTSLLLGMVEYDE
jgi:hypothetical protein